MIKKLLVVAVLVGAAWSVPASRAYMVRVGEPLLLRMGPLGERFLDPARRYNTGQELDLLLRQLRQDYTARQRLPNTRTFRAWVEANTTSGRAGADAWGNAYYLRQDRAGITVGSAGSDGQVGTEDDITRVLPF